MEPLGEGGLWGCRVWGLRVFGFRDLGFEDSGVWGLRFRVYWGYIGMMEKKMEVTILYMGAIYREHGKEMEATILLCIELIQGYARYSLKLDEYFRLEGYC